MKTKLQLTIAIVFFSLAVSCNGFAAQGSENEIYTKIKSALTIYNFDSLNAIRSTLAARYEQEKASSALYYLTYSEYKLLEMCLRKDTASRFTGIKESAEKHANELSGIKGFESEGKVLMAGIYMMRIAYNWSEAIALTPLLYATLADAEKADKNNPRVFLLRGMMKFNTPEMFGGSKEDALTNFLSAAKLFENTEETKAFNPEWGYLETLAWTGQVYAKLDNPETARFYYNKALSIEPGYGWVKYVLLPALDKK